MLAMKSKNFKIVTVLLRQLEAKRDKMLIQLFIVARDFIEWFSLIHT